MASLSSAKGAETTTASAKTTTSVANATNATNATTSTTSTSSTAKTASATSSTISEEPLSSNELKGANNYLQALAKALALISSMNLQMLQDDGAKAVYVSKAQIDLTESKIAAAEKNEATVLKEIQDQSSGGGCQLAMQIIMPIVTAIVAIISVVLAFFTDGISLLLIGIMIGVSLALTTFTTLNSALNLTAMLASAVGGVLANLIMALAMLVMVLLTAGVGIGMMMATLETRVAEMVLELTETTISASLGPAIEDSITTIGTSTIRATLTELKNALLSPQGIIFMVTTAVEILLSSGLLNSLITQFVEAVGGSAQDAMIVSIILTAVIAFFLVFLAAQSAGQEADEIADAADQGANVAAATLKAVGKNAQAAEAIAADSAQTMTQEALNVVKAEQGLIEKLLSKVAQIILDALEKMIGADPGAIRAASSLGDYGDLAKQAGINLGKLALGGLEMGTGFVGTSVWEKLLNSLSFLASLAQGGMQLGTGIIKLRMAEENVTIVTMLAEIRNYLAYYDMESDALQAMYDLFTDMLKEVSKSMNGMFSVIDNLIAGQQMVLQEMANGGI